MIVDLAFRWRLRMRDWIKCWLDILTDVASMMVTRRTNSSNSLALKLWWAIKVTYPTIWKRFLAILWNVPSLSTSILDVKRIPHIVDKTDSVKVCHSDDCNDYLAMICTLYLNGY